MKFEVEVTHHFKQEAKRLIKKYPSLKNELLLVVADLEKDPSLGSPLGKNCFKIRIRVASKGKSKSGGARIITHIQVIKSKIYLLSIFDKSEQSTLADNELEELLRYLDL